MIEALQRCRAAEKEQALFYRGLAALAEQEDNAELSERLQGLHADEQHHLSRLSARLLEFGAVARDLPSSGRPVATLDGWETVARDRENEEIRRYEALLAADLDESTRSLILEILNTERHHAEELGGKWMPA